MQSNLSIASLCPDISLTSKRVSFGVLTTTDLCHVPSCRAAVLTVLTVLPGLPRSAANERTIWGGRAGVHVRLKRGLMQVRSWGNVGPLAFSEHHAKYANCMGEAEATRCSLFVEVSVLYRFECGPPSLAISGLLGPVPNCSLRRKRSKDMWRNRSKDHARTQVTQTGSSSCKQPQRTEQLDWAGSDGIRELAW